MVTTRTGTDVPDSEFDHRTAAELLDDLAACRVSAVRLTQRATARIDRHDRTPTVCVRDFDRALAPSRVLSLLWVDLGFERFCGHIPRASLRRSGTDYL